MANLLREVNNHFGELHSGRKGAFFIKDGNNWTIEFGLSKRNRQKFEGVYIKGWDLAQYQTQVGMMLYIERKYADKFS